MSGATPDVSDVTSDVSELVFGVKFCLSALYVLVWCDTGRVRVESPVLCHFAKLSEFSSGPTRDCLVRSKLRVRCRVSFSNNG